MPRAWPAPASIRSPRNQVISAVPLLPGAGIYYTMSLGLNGSTQLALQRGFATAGIAGSIAAAILLVSSVVRLFTAQRKK